MLSDIKHEYQIHGQEFQYISYHADLYFYKTHIMRSKTYAADPPKGITANDDGLNIWRINSGLSNPEKNGPGEVAATEASTSCERNQMQYQLSLIVSIFWGVMISSHFQRHPIWWIVDNYSNYLLNR